MKRHAFISASVAIAAMSALVGCSDSDMESPVADNGAIRFAANTDFNSRAGDVTTNNLTEFNVYAYTLSNGSPALFMDNVTVTKSSSNTWTYSPIKFWPASSVDFFAYAPASWIGTAGIMNPVKYTNDEATTDLVYAVAAGLTGNGTQPNAQVVLNFRHALSKVTVLLSSTNPDLRVDVTNVALANLKSVGEFTFPRHTTTGTPSDLTTGTWSNLSDNFPYLLHMSSSLDDVVTLTSTPTDFSASGFGGPKYLIPQTLTWRSMGAKDDNYIVLMGSVYDAKTNVKLWPNANTPEENIVQGSTLGDGLLKFPLSTSQFSEWKPGYHYVYNIVVNANSEMGAIEFGSPTVDTYVEVVTSYK